MHRDSVVGEVDDPLFTDTLASIGCQDEVMDFLDGPTIDASGAARPAHSRN